MPTGTLKIAGRSTKDMAEGDCVTAARLHADHEYRPSLMTYDEARAVNLRLFELTEEAARLNASLDELLSVAGHIESSVADRLASFASALKEELASSLSSAIGYGGFLAARDASGTTRAIN